MSTERERMIQLTPQEFKEFIDSVGKAAAEAAANGAYLAAALALEQFAEAVEKAAVSTPSEAARQSADAVIRAAAAGARREAQSLRAKAQPGGEPTP